TISQSLVILISNMRMQPTWKRDYEAYQIYQALESLVQEMDDFVDAVVVEGARDKAALRGLGTTKEILMCCSGFSCARLVDYLGSKYKKKRVAILTDYDRAGNGFNKKLSARLEREGVRVERRFREAVGRILKARGMQCVESINSFRRLDFAAFPLTPSH
ncbi:MAG: toprim domain-containing protein, partial [Candidatus Methanospirareceae archaeon]